MTTIPFRSRPRRSARAVLASLLLVAAAATPAFARDCLDYSNYSAGEPAAPWGATLFGDVILDVAVMAGHAYLVTEGGDLRIVELSVPQAPFEVSLLRLGLARAGRIDVQGCYAYVGLEAHLQGVDITSANHPFPVGGWTAAARIVDLACGDGLLVTCVADTTLEVALAPECTPPLRVAVLPLSHPGRAVALAGTRAFVGGDGVLQAIDCSVPAAPVALPPLAIPGAVNDLAVWGDTLLAVTDEDLLLLDLASGGSPLLADVIPLPGAGRAVSGADRQVHVAGADGHWWVFSPDHYLMQVPVGWGVLPEPARAAQLEGPAVFFAAGESGLQVGWLQCPIVPAVAVPDGPGPRPVTVSVWPNPANPRVRITLEGAAPGPLTVDLVDAAGRRVRSLAVRSGADGRAVCEWDGRDEAGAAAASGVYLARVAGPDGPVSARLTLLR